MKCRLICFLLVVIVLAISVSGCVDDGGTDGSFSAGGNGNGGVDFYVSPSTGQIKPGMEISPGFYLPIDGSGGTDWGYDFGY